ncbi:Muscle M-line assembly protein unc-89 [Cercospora zeina]
MQDKQKWTPNREEQADLDAIDTELQRMREHITIDPYVMTIPQDVEPRYHHRYEAQAQQWLYSTPFSEGEHEATQYLTFHYHEPGKGMYMLHNSRPIGEPSANGHRDKPRPGTGANTPNGGVKKTISFSAYKKGKQTGDTSTPERGTATSEDAPAKQPAVKGPVERMKAETQEMLAAVAEETEDIQKMQKEKSPEQGDLKRKRDQRDEASGQAEKKPEGEQAPKNKKQKVETLPRAGAGPQDTRPPKVPTDSKLVNGDKYEAESGLPPRLSPGMPPRLSPGLPAKLSPLHSNDTTTPAITHVQSDTVKVPEKLPSRLSPSIPENIAEALKARVSSKVAASSTIRKDKDSKLTPLKKSDGIAKHKSPVPRNGHRARSPSPLAPPDGNLKAVTADSKPRDKSTALSQDEEIVVAKGPKAKLSEKVETVEKPRLIVRLKFRRARRDDIHRILKMRSKPDKSILAPTQSTAEPAAVTKAADQRPDDRKEEAAKVKGVAQKVGPAKKKERVPVEEPPGKQPEKTASKQSEKRPASPKRKADDEKQGPAAKRKKLEPNDALKEPSTPAQRDMDSQAAPRSGQHNTPGTRKDLLSQAMRREQSQDSNATHTPPATSSTPSVAGNVRTNGLSRPPSSQPSSKTPRQNAFEVEQKRFEILGRELKHAATAHLTHSQTSVDQKLAAIKSVESFLCYLLAFTCADEAAAAADPRQVPPYRIWRSLNGLYAFVKRTTDAYLPLSGLTHSLGVVVNSHILGISAVVADPPSQATLVDVALLLHRAVAGADEKLDVDALQDCFPRCWKDRTKKMPPNDKLDPAKLGGQYKLPLGPAATPVRAARAGHAMLREWMDREKLDYSLKLKL